MFICPKLILIGMVTFSQETAFLKKVIQNITKFVVSTIPHDRLISLYLGGRILTRDRAETSDIDLFAIVSDKDPRLLSKWGGFPMVDYLKQHRNDLCGGRECSFHVVHMCQLERDEGGGDKAFWIKALKASKLLWGKKIDFNVFGEEISHINELKENVKLVTDTVKEAKKNNYTYSNSAHKFQNAIKYVLYCAQVEAIVLKGYKYDPSFYKLIRFLKDEEDHIVHECWRLRAMGTKVEEPKFAKERKLFSIRAENYIRHLITAFSLHM